VRDYLEKTCSDCIVKIISEHEVGKYEH